MFLSKIRIHENKKRMLCFLLIKRVFFNDKKRMKMEKNIKNKKEGRD